MPYSISFFGGGAWSKVSKVSVNSTNTDKVYTLFKRLVNLVNQREAACSCLISLWHGLQKYLLENRTN